MSEPVGKPQILLLRSTSKHFPFDFQPDISKAGYPVLPFDSLESFLASPARQQPFIAVVEIGHAADIERALIVYEWSEQMQPLAPARYLFLLSSKNISLGERAHRFGGAEIAVLPQPARSLLFKLELQGRLLASPAPGAAKSAPRGFSANVETSDTDGRKRVLVARGQKEKSGDWQQGADSPQGKIRWRWIRKPEPGAKPEKEEYTWEAENQSKPQFDHTRDAWVMEGEGADLLCFRNETQIFSALAVEEHARAASKENRPDGGKKSASAAGQGHEPESEPAAAHEQKYKTPQDPPLKGESSAEKIRRLLAEAPPATEPNAAEAPKVAAKAARPARTPAEREAAQAAGPTAEKSPPEKNEAPARSQPGTFGKAAGNYMPPPPALFSNRLAEGKDPQPPGSPAPSAPGGQSPAKGERTLPAAGAPALPDAHTPDEDDFSRAEPFSSLQDKFPAEAPARALGGTQENNPEVGGNLPESAAKSAAAAPDAPPAKTRPRWEQEEKPAASTAPPAGVSEKAAPQPGKQAPGESEQQRAATAPVSAPLKAPAGPVAPATGESSAAERNQQPPRAEASPDRGLSPAGSLAPPNPGTMIVQDTGASAGAISAQVPGSASSAEGEALVPGTAPVKEEHARARARGEAMRTILPFVPASDERSRLADDESRRFLQNRHFLLMTLAELHDQESSWHPVGVYRIYLSARHRYYGLPSAEEVLPLWIYEGELAPEFIDEKNSWKFYDRLPVSVPRLEGLPVEVLEYVYKMAGQTVPEETRQKSAPRPSRAESVPGYEDTTRAPVFVEKETPRKPKGAWGGIIMLVKKIIGG